MADHVIVMSDAARARLCSRFDVDPAIVTTIPHGAAIPTGRVSHEPGARPTILTCGLIGPGKGIERVIDAMQSLHRLPARPRYLVAGQTHPKVFAVNGESYRNSLVERASRNGVGGSVFFDAAYRDVESHTALIQSCAVVACALRLHGPGDLRRARSRHRGRPTGGCHGVSPRGRVVGERRWHHRRP